MINKLKNQKGFAAFFVTILIFAVVFAISSSIFILTYGEQKITQNVIKSSQAYYMAEAGIEDAIYRIKKSLNIAPSYTMTVGRGSVGVTVSSPSQNNRIVTALSNVSNVFRKIETRLSIESINPEFFYGAQAGELGIVMENNSSIEGAGGSPGNIYSNGPIFGGNGATITGTVSIAGGASLDNLIVFGNAYANAIDDSKICGDAYYQIIDSSSLDFLNDPSSPTCPDPLTPGIANPNSIDPPLQNMPISDSDIDRWKQDAAAGGVRYSDLRVSANMSYGPQKIDGNLILTSNNKVLTVTGTIYATGYLDVANGSSIQCDASYGKSSCVIVIDKWAHIENNGIFKGSGQSGSYIMVLTASDCDGSSSANCTHHKAAMDLHNGATGVIFYANDGLIYLHNGVEVTELTAKKIHLNQGAVITYEQGLINASFPSGSGGSREVVSWKEVE